MIDPSPADVAAELEAAFDGQFDAYLRRQLTCAACGRRLPVGVRHVQPSPGTTGPARSCRELTW